MSSYLVVVVIYVITSYVMIVQLDFMFKQSLLIYFHYRRLIAEIFPHAIIIADHFHIVAQAYRALNNTRLQIMKYFGSDSHEWRALKHYWKLLVTQSENLKYDNYWSRRNFAYSQLTDVKVIHRLLSFDNQLK